MMNRKATAALILALALEAGHSLGAEGIPPPPQCSTRVYTSDGETIIIYQGSSVKHYRLSAIAYMATSTLPPITGTESKFQGMNAQLGTGKAVPIPYVPGAVDVESTSIAAVNESTATIGKPLTLYVCFEYF